MQIANRWQGFPPRTPRKNDLVDAEQVARNDSIFRDANESIERAAREYGRAEQVPFICECAEPECRELISLSLREYEGIRANPKRFVVAPGHEASAQQHVVTVDERPGYHVVEKIGAAAEVAAELDPRTA
jgi:hypothetical protein